MMEHGHLESMQSTDVERRRVADGIVEYCAGWARVAICMIFYMYVYIECFCCCSDKDGNEKEALVSGGHQQVIFSIM